jgi:hypothetical protein
MKALFPYLGESVLREILAADASAFLGSFRPEPANSVEVLMQIPLTFPKAGISFDGFQNLDLALLVNETEVIPIEVKLGRKGLHKANVDRLLADCSLSTHQRERRVAGNMLSVLNRNVAEDLRNAVGTDCLHANTTFGAIPVSADWGIIARASVIKSWERYPPLFNNRIHFFTLETICENYGRGRFNALASTMLQSSDYYADWISNGA